MSQSKMSKVFWMYGGHCYYCGKQLDPYSGWQIDHMIPRLQKGSNALSNLVPACTWCNHSKRARTPQEFKDYKKQQIEKSVENCRSILARLEANADPAAVEAILERLSEASRLTSALEITWYGEAREPQHPTSEQSLYFLGRDDPVN